MWKKPKWMYGGKYQKTIYIWTSIFFIVAQMLFSTAVLVQTNQQEMKTNYEMNEQIFLQAAYNVQQSDQVIRGLCESLFVNPKISKMLYGSMQEENIYEWIQEFQSVCEPILLSNSQIHSIYVYNRGMNRFFSSYRYLGYQDEELVTLLDDESLQVLTPLVRTIDNPDSKSGKSKVITYILYDSLAQSGKPDGAIIVNVDFDKFNAEVRQLLTFSEEEKSRILIFNKKDSIDLGWKQEETDDLITSRIQEMVRELEFPKGKDFLLKTEKISGEKYGIFFTNVPSMNWTVVKLQSYREVFRYVNQQKIMIMAVSVVFCAVMLMLIYFLARKIYSPIGQLVEKVMRHEPEELSEISDIEYLNQTYENLFRSARESQRKGNQKKILLAYNLRTLFIDGDKTEQAVWDGLQSVDRQLFQKENSFGVGILQIDNYQAFREKYDHKTQELYKFVIENILSEILDNHGYRSVVIPLEEDKLAVLVHRDHMEGEYRSEMEECFRSTNENLKKFSKLSFSVSVSAYRQGIGALPELYHMAETRLPYRYILGKEAVIFYDYEVEQAHGREMDVVMKELRGHIQEGTREGIVSDFARLTELLKRQSSNRLTEVIAGQAIHILHMIDAQEKSNNASLGRIFMERYTKVLSMETWAEMSDCLQKMIFEVLTLEDRQTQKTNLLMNTIQNIVEEEFENTNLCLQQISEMVKMSTQYVGRVFKSAAGISVAEYINEYRLNKSIEIMMATGCTVNEVLGQIGMENESQYYRLFKKKYGVTPKVYMLKLLSEEKATKGL